MPRSGTTLTEQILASHPEVYGAGELGDIKTISRRLLETGTDLSKPGTDLSIDYDSCIDRTDQAKLTELANSYLETLRGLNSEARYVTDKMPHNFQHLGLISLLFPEARVIHCRRNPLDCGLSIYFQHFIWTHDYANDLAKIGEFYTEYERLMRHWEAVIDIPMLTVHYEDMIEDQEDMTRQLLEFCELEWNDAGLNFHSSKRFVAAGSYDQVRQPLQHLVTRWKNMPGISNRLRTPCRRTVSWVSKTSIWCPEPDF